MGMEVVVSWIWSTNWMLAAFVLGLLAFFVVLFIRDHTGMRSLQPAAILVAFGMLVGFGSWVISGQWPTAIAAFIWFTAIPPVAFNICAVAFAFLKSAWKRLGDFG